MKKKILIIEDDEATCEILEFIATSLNCEAITSTYVLPVRTIKEAAPDLILLDHWLGDHLGGDLCLKLKDHPETKHIPVIIVSVHDAIREISRQYCADDYIEKPFSIKVVEDKIKKYLPQIS